MNEKTIEIDGNAIRYIEEGTSGENLLLIHGLGASAERWEHVIPQFAKNYRAHSRDLSGPSGQILADKTLFPATNRI